MQSWTIDSTDNNEYICIYIYVYVYVYVYVFVYVCVCVCVCLCICICICICFCMCMYMYMYMCMYVWIDLDIYTQYVNIYNHTYIYRYGKKGCNLIHIGLKLSLMDQKKVIVTT